MKKSHYINIGTARSGTTWLFENLIRSKQIDYNKDKEPGLKILDCQQDYIEYYKNFNFSLNFNPAFWAIDSNQISFIKKHSTHCSTILRNPYEVINSLYCVLNPNLLYSEYAFAVSNTIGYADIIKRWCNHDNFKIFYYDELVNDTQNYLNTVTNFLNIENLKPLSKINATNNKKLFEFGEEQKQMVNYEIKKLEDFLQKDFSSWIK